MSYYTGKICPFCKTAIREGDAVKVCPSCGIAHHESCWNANGGCTTFGCSQQNHSSQRVPTSGAVCSNCGAPLRDGQSFCAHCGTPRSIPMAPPVCSKCGAPLQEGQAFCPKCGQKAGLGIDPNVNNAISQFNAGVQQQKKKAKLKMPILIGVAVVIVLALFLVLKGPAVEEIILSETAIEMRVDDTTTVTYTINPDKASDAEVTWKSSNTSVATVSSSGKITAKGEGSCTITATAGGESDTVRITVKAGPDFKALYNQYCESTWASVGSDGSYLSVDTNPYNWDDDGLAYPEAYYAVENINNALGLPASLLEDMSTTTGADGKQTAVYDDVTVTWKYHPDKGLEVTYKLN